MDPGSQSSDKVKAKLPGLPPNQLDPTRFVSQCLSKDAVHGARGRKNVVVR